MNVVSIMTLVIRLLPQHKKNLNRMQQLRISICSFLSVLLRSAKRGVLDYFPYVDYGHSHVDKKLFLVSDWVTGIRTDGPAHWYAEQHPYHLTLSQHLQNCTCIDRKHGQQITPQLEIWWCFKLVIYGIAMCPCIKLTVCKQTKI